MKRRDFLASTAALPLLHLKKTSFKISLAQFSLAGSLMSGKLKNIDFPNKALDAFGVHALEWVSMFFEGKVKNLDYIKSLKQRTDDLGLTNVLIMVDSEGHLGDSDPTKRAKAVDNHLKWLEAAKLMGCHSI